MRSTLRWNNATIPQLRGKPVAVGGSRARSNLICCCLSLTLSFRASISGTRSPPHSLGFGSSSDAMSWTQEASAGKTFNLTLLGQYAAANFNAGADGHGGTLITDPPGSGSVVQAQLVAHHCRRRRVVAADRPYWSDDCWAGCREKRAVGHDTGDTGRWVADRAMDPARPMVPGDSRRRGGRVSRTPDKPLQNGTQRPFLSISQIDVVRGTSRTSCFGVSSDLRMPLNDRKVARK
jgi:hypothetical protein